jgi:hypothetical protein
MFKQKTIIVNLYDLSKFNPNSHIFLGLENF